MSEAFDSFVDKWQQRQPEMQLLETFCPPAERRRMRAWGALVNELAEAMFATSDAGVARTKLAWWGEDLAADATGVRHPVGRVLLGELGPDAPTVDAWRRLVGTAIELSLATRQAAEALPPAQPALAFGELLAGIEQQVFGRPSDASAIAVDLRCAYWLPSLADGVVAGADRIAAELAGGLPSANGLCLYRSGRIAFDRWRLRRLQAGGATAAVRHVPAFRGLLLAWRAGRASRA